MKSVTFNGLYSHSLPVEVATQVHWMLSYAAVALFYVITQYDIEEFTVSTIVECAHLGIFWRKLLSCSFHINMDMV